MPQFEKHFTVDEANALLPEIRELLHELQAARDHLEIGQEKARPVIRAAKTNGGGKEATAYLSDLQQMNQRLQRLHELGRGKRMVIVLDNARYHHAVLLAPLRHKYRKVLSLLFLPPYSPQLAPIERVWKLTRRLATHNRYFATLAELLGVIEACFDQWRKANSVLRRLCGIT